MIRTLVVAVTVIAVATSSGVASSAVAKPAEQPIAVDVGSPRESTDADGRALLFDASARASDRAEEILTGHTESGVPFMLVAQSALPAEIPASTPIVVDPAELAAATAAVGNVPDEMLAAYSTSDAPTTFELGFSADELSYDPEMLDPNFAFAVTATTTSFGWVSNASAANFEVLRDDVVAGRTSEPQFSESGLKRSTAYNYEIVAYAADGSVLSQRMLPIETLGAPVDSDRSQAVVPMSYQPYTTAFTYETFIPDAQVPLGFMETMGCGQAGFPSRTFGGDNRSWATPTFATPWDTPNYRTMLFANVNWDNPAPYDVIIQGGIGPTKLYDNGALIETRTATFDDTEITDTYKSGSYAQTRWDHSVGNPFCLAGAITYHVVVRFYRSGTIQIEGWRSPVPNHEAYGRWDSGSGEFWNAMYLDTNEGFQCLTGICGDDTIYLSETH
ncbi:MAG: hypothetical protein ACSLE8_09605 [Rhodococcus sp. (in: high G+C Gram-positive bacteria)]